MTVPKRMTLAELMALHKWMTLAERMALNGWIVLLVAHTRVRCRPRSKLHRLVTRLHTLAVRCLLCTARSSCLLAGSSTAGSCWATDSAWKSTNETDFQLGHCGANPSLEFREPDVVWRVLACFWDITLYSEARGHTLGQQWLRSFWMKCGPECSLAAALAFRCS
eukprot:3553526-Amphidinium_carterae.4